MHAELQRRHTVLCLLRRAGSWRTNQVRDPASSLFLAAVSPAASPGFDRTAGLVPQRTFSGNVYIAAATVWLRDCPCQAISLDGRAMPLAPDHKSVHPAACAIRPRVPRGKPVPIRDSGLSACLRKEQGLRAADRLMRGPASCRARPKHPECGSPWASRTGCARAFARDRRCTRSSPASAGAAW